jgi:hypothetical protein
MAEKPSKEIKVIRPQAGYQMMALASPADIVIGGGAAGVGKTFTLLLEPLRHAHVADFGGVIFRRTSPQIRNEGGLWDTSMGIYSHVNAKPRESFLEWVFEKGAKLKFSHLEHEKNVFDWQGAQIPFIGFDELTHFSKKMFFYMLSRNRSVCGVKPYVRATCNPDPDSWVAEFISWWIDQETGLPIPEREGIVRYLVAEGDDYIWGDTMEEARVKAWHILEPVVTRAGLDPKDLIKSVTFISGSIYDNKELLKVNPAYIGNLLAQDKETKAALLDGNWKVVLSDNDIYDYGAFLGMFHNVIEAKSKNRYITADIAMKGSDKLVIMVWYGKELTDILIMDKSKGNEVVDGIKMLARKHSIQNRHIIFDNDGVGQFVDGFIEGAVPFNNGATPLPSPENPTKDKHGKPQPENYEHLKAQCFYRSGASVSRGEYRISEEVANRMYDEKMTIRQRLLFERKAIKEGKKDSNMKLCVIRKDEMKSKLNGQSPDMMDAFMMREYFELKPVHQNNLSALSALR